MRRSTVSRAFFFDTSALIKLYHHKAGTERVEDIFGRAENSIIISDLATVEMLLQQRVYKF